MLSVFGRTGLVGFATLLVVLFAMITRTRLAGRESLQANQPDSALAPWLLVWAIFTAACFGVVLEGPMGAIVFWITLGMANAGTHRTASTTAIEEAAEPVAALPAGAR
jgi:succinate-acetate transporter protein